MRPIAAPSAHMAPRTQAAILAPAILAVELAGLSARLRVTHGAHARAHRGGCHLRQSRGLLLHDFSTTLVTLRAPRAEWAILVLAHLRALDRVANRAERHRDLRRGGRPLLAAVHPAAGLHLDNRRLRRRWDSASCPVLWQRTGLLLTRPWRPSADWPHGGCVRRGICNGQGLGELVDHNLVGRAHVVGPPHHRKLRFRHLRVRQVLVQVALLADRTIDVSIRNGRHPC
mmetsp:Transcript_67668/g.195933  ORF Transcript_67668/g.195933 Transcript_67668/m.195933 type:complete len:229 (-) Transcript_67668:272-958(-)